MSTSSRPPWAGGPWANTGPGAADPNMRVSDAERAEVADRLSRHYGDGRLDQAEFDERLDRAMKAKTRADFDGLFTDLPEPGPAGGQPFGAPFGPASGPAAGGRPGLAGPPAGPCAPWHRRHRGLFLLLVVVAAIVMGPALAHLIVPWLVIALVAFVVIRIAAHRPRRN